MSIIFRNLTTLKYLNSHGYELKSDKKYNIGSYSKEEYEIQDDFLEVILEIMCEGCLCKFDTASVESGEKLGYCMPYSRGRWR